MFFIKNLLNLKRIYKQFIVFFIDVISSLIALFMSFYLRLDLTYSFVFNDFLVFLISLIIFVPIFYFGGFYNSIFRFYGINSIYNILKYWFIYLLFFSIILIFFASFLNVPRSIAIIQPFVFLIFIIVNRITIIEIINKISYIKKYKKLIIIGAGNTAYQLIPLLDEYNIVYLVDRSKDKIGKKILNIQIKNINKLSELIIENYITHIFVALPNISENNKINIQKICK